MAAGMQYRHEYKQEMSRSDLAALLRRLGAVLTPDAHGEYGRNHGALYKPDSGSRGNGRGFEGFEAAGDDLAGALPDALHGFGPGDAEGGAQPGAPFAFDALVDTTGLNLSDMGGMGAAPAANTPAASLILLVVSAAALLAGLLFAFRFRR